MSKMNMVSAINQALHLEMERDETMIVMGEDVGIDGGVFRATQGLLDRFGEERVIDTPLAESCIAGMAIGMAMNGLRPVAEMQFMGFSLLALNQMIAHAARMRNRTRSRLTVPMVLRMPYGGGVRALEHHSESTEVFHAHIPGLKVVVPSTPREAKGLLLSSIRDPDPVIFLEPKRSYRLMRQEVDEGDFTIPLTQARTVREGDDVTVIGYGGMIPLIEKAAQQMEGFSCEIIDLRTISPMDSETIMSSVRRTGRAVVVQESPRSFGVGAEIAARIMEKAMLHLEAPVERVAAPDITVPLPKAEDYYYISPDKIMRGIAKVLEY